jgi:hypothetical protein
MASFKEFFYKEEDYYSNQELVSIYMHYPDKKIKEIAEITGKSIGEIYRVLHSYNVSPNRLKTNHKNVVEFYNYGMNVKQIAELTGYTTRNVRYIITKVKNG